MRGLDREYNTDNNANQMAPAEAVEPSHENKSFLNKWALFKNAYREELAEFLSTLVLIVIGTGVNCQYTLQGSGVALSVPLTWAMAVAGGVWLSGGVSGGHVNIYLKLISSYYF